MVTLAGRYFCFKLEERVPLMAFELGLRTGFLFAEPGFSGLGRRFNAPDSGGGCGKWRNRRGFPYI